MFDGEWKRCQSDTTEQLAKVLGIVTKSGVANDIMFEMLDSYVKADLTTNIDEDVRVFDLGPLHKNNVYSGWSSKDQP